MNNMFTTPCFIRKNTPELRKKLEELGYEPNNYECFWEDNNRYIITTIGEGYGYYTLCIKNCCLLENEIFIDCGTNEELFLALASLRDDTPINSFYYFKERLCKCEKLELKDLNFNTGRYYYKCRSIDNPMICFCCQEKDLQKATVKEIIEHFNDK